MSHPKPTPDFLIQTGGTVALWNPLTAAARAWLKAHCPADEDHQYLGHALAVEHRYGEPLVALAREDGLSV
jgi:hypothetical protein